MAAGTTQRDWTTTGSALLCDRGRLIALRTAENRCPVCKVRMYLPGAKREANDMWIDHIEACANGGGNDQIVPMCLSCNCSKGATPLAEWLPGRLVVVRKLTQRGAKGVARKVEQEIYSLSRQLRLALICEGLWNR